MLFICYNKSIRLSPSRYIPIIQFPFPLKLWYPPAKRFFPELVEMVKTRYNKRKRKRDYYAMARFNTRFGVTIPISWTYKKWDCHSCAVHSYQCDLFPIVERVQWKFIPSMYVSFMIWLSRACRQKYVYTTKNISASTLLSKTDFCAEIRLHRIQRKKDVSRTKRNF